MAEVSTSRPGAFLAPPLGRHHVTRPRLDAALDDAIEAPLVLVSAPAGSGKSVALSAWLGRRGGSWYALATDDNDPAVFWPGLASALGLDVAQHLDNARAVATALFEAPTAPAIVVLDDYHLVTNPVVHAGVDQLIAEAPASLRLVLATRHDPPLMLSRLRAHGALRELRFDDLRFDEQEIGAVLQATTGVSLQSDDLRRLARRTDGWAAAVQLVGLSLRGHDDASAVVDAFTGDNRHVADYLRDEVLALLPDRLRSFLLDTAFLERLTAPLCAAVTGVDDAQLVLEELERRNLFVVALDDRRRWFRYHHLFAEWLRLQRRDDDTERQRAAAEWFLASGDPAAAVRHLIAAGEAGRAADVIEAERWRLVGLGREETLRDWVQTLPPDVQRERPGLTLAAAWVAHHAGRWDDVGRLAASLADDDSVEPLVRAEVLLLESGRLVAIGDHVEALRIARAGLELVDAGEPRGRTGLLLVEGRALVEAGDLDGAARSFTDAAALAARHGVTIVLLIARSHLAEIDRLSGNAETAEALAREALERAEADGLSDHPEAAVANLTLAESLLDRGRVDDAAPFVTRGVELAGRVRYVPRQRQAERAQRRYSSAGPRRTSSAMVEQLTGRELSVLRLLPSSLTPREIGVELYLSLNTIKTHTRGIYRKLGVQTRHEAIEEARRRGLL